MKKIIIIITLTLTIRMGKGPKMINPTLLLLGPSSQTSVLQRGLANFILPGFPNIPQKSGRNTEKFVQNLE